MIDYTSAALISCVIAAIAYFLTKSAEGKKLNALQTKLEESERTNGLLLEQRIKEALEHYKSSEDYSNTLTLRFQQGRAEGAESALQKFKSSDEFETALSLEHAKGRIAGAEVELSKFLITYTPVVVDHETWISHKVDIGYDMQLHYSGFPIGEPTRHITHHQEKSKDENINKLVGLATNTLELIASAASKQKIPVTVNKKPTRTKAPA
jgi:hypothetical protein